jgi:TgpA N-terminal domain/Transglutaminase-like superfamily
MNGRLAAAAAIAVAASSLSLYAVVMGNAWMVAGLGAILVVALAGMLTRLAALPAAIAATVATLVAVVPLLAGHGAPGLVGAVLIVAAVAASATGARLLRAVAVLATYCACLLIYLNLVFASSGSFLHVIPTSSSIHQLSQLPAQYSAAIGFSPPVPGTRGIDFIAAGGIGAVAIIVDILAVRLRRPALAGLPLLLLFSVPVASNLKGFGFPQTLTFAASITAYLALLSSDSRQRLRMWGRLVTLRRIAAMDEVDAVPDTRQLAASGRRVGMAAVGLAMLVPIALVGSKPHDLFEKSPGHGGGGSIGTEFSGTVSPLVGVGRDLARSTPANVLTYQTNSPNPQYLQEFVLNYDPASNTWLLPSGTQRVLAVSQQLPEPVPGLTAGISTSTVTTHVSMESLLDGPLPLPYAPTQVILASGGASESPGTLMVFPPPEPSNLQFTVVSKEPEPTGQDLGYLDQVPGNITHAYGGYTGPDAAELRRIAVQVTNGADTNLQYADALENWFTSKGGFAYSVKAQLPTSRGWLVNFLTHDKRGECQQFAFAFAVLARLIGIPSRIAVGFTPGTRLANGSWLVTTADAHAWPELYFSDVGWIRFEPTPSGRNGQGTAVPPPYANIAPISSKSALGPSSATGPGNGKTAKSQNGANPKLRKIGGGGGPSGSAAARNAGGGFPVGIIVLLAVAALVALPGTVRWLTGRRRWMATAGDAALAHTAWRELTDYLTDYGLARRPSESPRALSCRVAEEASMAPAERGALTRIGAAEERARYSLSTEPGTRLHADVKAVRKALAASSTRTQRLRARLLPPSTLAATRRAFQSANQVLSWIDAPVLRLRRWPRRTAQFRAG